jgi:hypothetical protein
VIEREREERLFFTLASMKKSRFGKEKYMIIRRKNACRPAGIPHMGQRDQSVRSVRQKKNLIDVSEKGRANPSDSFSLVFASIDSPM